MFSKREREGEILIDHRNSPGITQEFLHHHHIGGPAVGAGVTYRSALVVCHHCQADVILRPDRTRERAWCWSCDHYICDGCGVLMKLGAPCTPFIGKMEAYYEMLIKGFGADVARVKIFGI